MSDRTQVDRALLRELRELFTELEASIIKTGNFISWGFDYDHWHYSVVRRTPRQSIARLREHPLIADAPDECFGGCRYGPHGLGYRTYFLYSNSTKLRDCFERIATTAGYNIDDWAIERGVSRESCDESSGMLRWMFSVFDLAEKQPEQFGLVKSWYEGGRITILQAKRLFGLLTTDEKYELVRLKQHGIIRQIDDAIYASIHAIDILCHDTEDDLT